MTGMRNLHHLLTSTGVSLAEAKKEFNVMKQTDRQRFLDHCKAMHPFTDRLM
jgi:hypothetical protein